MVVRWRPHRHSQCTWTRGSDVAELSLGDLARLVSRYAALGQLADAALDVERDLVVHFVLDSARNAQ